MKNKPKRQQHRMTGQRFYKIWKGIQGRCYHKSDWAYQGYGSVGIKSDWKNDFLKFKDEMYESYLAHRSVFGDKDTTIERLDPKGNYCKENCRWATQLEQANNRSDTMFLTIDGVKKSVRDWSRETGIKYETIRRRILVGWPEDKVLSQLKFNRYNTPLDTLIENQ